MTRCGARNPTDLHQALEKIIMRNGESQVERESFRDKKSKIERTLEPRQQRAGREKHFSKIGGGEIGESRGRTGEYESDSKVGVEKASTPIASSIHESKQDATADVGMSNTVSASVPLEREVSR